MKTSFLNILVLVAVTALFSMTMGTAGRASICTANRALSIDGDPNDPEPHPECTFETVIDGDPNDPEPHPECTFETVIDGDPNDPEPHPEFTFETVIDGDPNDPEPHPETA